MNENESCRIKTGKFASANSIIRAVIGRTQHGVVVPCGSRSASVVKVIYMTKRPLPTYAEKLKEIEKKVNEWKRHKHHRQHGLQMRDVAEQLGISTVNLSNYVNTVEGMNFSAWLNSLRVEDAKRLMQAHPELSIYDIGYKVGHPIPDTFKKAFVTIMGQTPNEWRKENIGK